MKYIKKYEKLKNKHFEMGDYVKVHSLLPERKNKVYIIDGFNDKKAILYENSDYYQYYLIDINPNHKYDEMSTQLWAEQQEIYYPSEEQLNDYKIKIDANYYNL